MSHYPVVAPGQGLYEASSTIKHKPGSRAQFETTEGIVDAIYVTNAVATSMASGTPVYLSGNYGVGTAIWTAATGAYPPLGVLCQSLGASSASGNGGGAWCAYKGPITAIKVVATQASTINGMMMTAHSAGASMQTVASTIASVGCEIWGRRLGIVGGATTTIATSGGAGPVYLNLCL